MGKKLTPQAKAVIRQLAKSESRKEQAKRIRQIKKDEEDR